MQEKVEKLLNQAERLGFRFEQENGLLKAKKPRTCDAEQCEGVIAELAGIQRSANGRGTAGFLLPYLRSIFERRAIVECAKKYVGQPAWALGYGMGKIVGADSTSGNLQIAFATGTISVRAEDLVIICEDETELAPAPDGAPEAAGPRKGILRFFRGGASSGQEG